MHVEWIDTAGNRVGDQDRHDRARYGRPDGHRAATRPCRRHEYRRRPDHPARALVGPDATSGIARYELLQSTDGGSWTTVSTTLTSPTADRSLARLHTYRFRVRAVDKAGNVGAWIFGTPFWLSRYSEFNSAITYSGSWTTVSSPAAYWGGGAKRSGTAGARRRCPSPGARSRGSRGPAPIAGWRPST